MKLEFKYTIIYTLICLFLFWLIIKYGTITCNSFTSLQKTVEGITNISDTLTDLDSYSKKIVPYPKDALIDYNNINSPLYSKTVNLPINDPVSCKNFCGPKSQCVLTREQCTSDIDCKGCNPGPTPKSSCISKEVSPYDGAGKLGQNQGLQYSQLTTGFNNHNADFAQVYEGSKDLELKRKYEGVDLWTDSFNVGLELYNKKRQIADKYANGISNAIPLANSSKISQTEYEPKYPLSISATGLFYETTPPASNASMTYVGI